MTISRNQFADDRTVITDCELDASPEKVWRALTTPELLKAWLLPLEDRSDLESEFTFNGSVAGFGDKIKCKLITSDPHRLMRFSWREEQSDPTAPSKPALDTIVTFSLAETEAGGTRLRVSHRVVSPATTGTRIMMSIEAANNNPAPQIRLAA